MMTIKNAVIRQVSAHSFVVIGDTKRWGEGEILFQDITIESAEDYIRRNDPQAVWTFEPLKEFPLGQASQILPKFVKDLLVGASFVLGEKATVPGCTIEIRKPRPYMTARVWRNQVVRMLNWAKRYGADAWIDSIPEYTSHKYTQFARVTITDPVMVNLLENIIILEERA